MSTIKGSILQPNPYAGGRVAPPIVMPTEPQPGTGGNSSGQGTGQNSVTIDDDVSLSGPSTELSGTPQTNPPYPDGPVHPTDPNTDLTNTVPGMVQVPGKPKPIPPTGSATGWVQSGGAWYYINPDTKKLVTGWFKDDGLWYYLDPTDGHMLIDWQYIDGEWYYLETTDGNGQMVTGWKQHNGEWYYLFAGGVMAHGGWARIDGEWYRFRDSSGEMEFNKIITFESKKYYVGENGAMVTNTTGEEFTITCDRVTYGVDEDGVCTALTMTAPPDADIQAWKDYIINDASLSDVRKTIVIEALETIEEGCMYHQLRETIPNATPKNCMYDCDTQEHPKQEKEYKFSETGAYNIEDPLYLDCSYFVKHCYWKADITMDASTTHGLLKGSDFSEIREENLKPADIAVYWEEYKDKYNIVRTRGHCMIFVGWTSNQQMVWAEMANHRVDGKVSCYVPESKYDYKRSKELA